MRLARALLFLALSGAVAHADEAKPAEARPVETHVKVPLRVVRMLPETHQVLLFDKIKGTHVVVAAGEAVEGFVVDSIDADDVTLLSDGGATFVLEAPEPAWRHHRDGAEGRGDRRADGRGDARAADGRGDARAADARPAGAVRVVSAQSGEPQPADPYADLAAPSTIGTGADGVRVVEAPDAPATAGSATSYGGASYGGTSYGAASSYGAAPSTIGTGADGVRVVEAPDAAITAPPVTAAAPVSASATAAAPATAAVSAPATAAGSAAVPAAAAVSAAAPGTAAGSAPGTAAVSAPATAAGSAPATAAGSAPAAATAAKPADATGDALAAALTGDAAPSAAPAISAPAASPATAASAAPSAATADAAVLARADVSAALSNFGALASAIHGAFTPKGVRVDSVAAGSLFAKAGLRAGDTIASVDGVPLRSLDDAADLYARAATARNVSVAIVRAGKPTALRVTIQ